MNGVRIKRKSLIYISAVILFIAFLATVILTSNNVAFANSTADGEIFYGASSYGESIGNATSEVEEFEYATKTSTIYYANQSYPLYYNSNNNVTNGCAPVAGASIIGFYDRFYEDLIPNSTPGFVRNDIYNYYASGFQSEPKQAVINTLYNDMKTNVISAGTSQAYYKSGLTAFVNRKGMNISFTSVMTNGKLDENKLIKQLQAGQPVTLYLQGYNISKVENNGDSIRIMKVIYPTNHIMIAYAYEKVEYFNSNGSLIKSKTYLSISSGMMGIIGVYVVNNNGILNDAEAVNIF